jgi:hypothetical protein
MKTLLDPFEIRSFGTDEEIEIEIDEPPPVLPPVRGPRVWVTEAEPTVIRPISVNQWWW